ncbi:MAG: hypothetical protein AAGD25_21755 [Cyanobacteria bacterium P01_F01_bin.150]
MFNQKSCSNAFQKMKLVPKAVVAVAGASLIVAGAAPVQAYNLQEAKQAKLENDAALIVGSYSASYSSVSSSAYSSVSYSSSAYSSASYSSSEYSSASYSSSTYSSSVVSSVVSSTITILTTSTITISSSSLPEKVRVSGTSFNQPSHEIDLTTTA